MENVFLIHGWNYTNYSKYGCKDAWSNRNDFIIELSKYFNVIKLNLPGFCGEPEPPKDWNLEDYADFFEQFILKSRIKPDYVLGYSFGGAVAIKWKLNYHNNSKIILVSPAITRAYKERKETKYLTIGKKLVPLFISKYLRHIYLKFIIKNSFYLQGTKFLRNSYLNIVKIDLADELIKIPNDKILLIFGEKDSATPPQVFKSRIGKGKVLDNLHIIEGGGHDIATTNYEQIVEIIKCFAT
ncbi:MAG: alpha/beta hydrolase [Saprospiraceae bacterium]|nr:alpha/beta hydrolase [Saprospiraceae bacterium]